jgi:RNA polymerase sigma-70 factor (sigma-E family)
VSPGVEFDEFAREQLPGLVGFAAALTGDRQLAQDLVQDTMVRAFLKWSRVAAAERPDLYLRRMVINGHLTWRQRWYQRTVHPVAEMTDEPTTVVGDPTGQVADRDELTALLAGLGRQQRAAIVLRFYEDRDDDEIAEALGCAPATVRGYISRGLAALRIRMRDGETAEGDMRATTEVATS